MRLNFSQAVQQFFSPDTFLPFLIGSIFLGVFGNAIYDILKKLLGDDLQNLLYILVLAGIVFTISVIWVARKIVRRSRYSFVFEQKSPPKYRGLILMVSTQTTACRVALDYHLSRLEYCWLICSQQTLPEANQLMEDYPHIKFDQPLVINNILDPLEYQQKVSRIYETLPKGLNDREVIGDYTGMTAHGSVGMVLACLDTKRPLQYTPANVDPITNRIIGSKPPIEILKEWQ